MVSAIVVADRLTKYLESKLTKEPPEAANLRAVALCTVQPTDEVPVLKDVLEYQKNRQAFLR
jgi:hypothetical protein